MTADDFQDITGRGRRPDAETRPFNAQIEYKPDLKIEISDEWNLNARILRALKNSRPAGCSLRQHLQPIAIEIGISYESLYRWCIGKTRSPQLWTVLGVAQWLDNEIGEDW